MSVANDHGVDKRTVHMPAPDRFSWIDKPLVAGLARPGSADELAWLREQGIELLISLTEDPPHRNWINEAGLFLIHIPVEDLTSPTQEQLDESIIAIRKAHDRNWGVGVHCGAGLGRTGTILACYLVTQGMTAKNAIARVRRLRPGSIENEAQERAVIEFAERWQLRQAP
jgi:atypical dual specificity phosphatase